MTSYVRAFYGSCVEAWSAVQDDRRMQSGLRRTLVKYGGKELQAATQSKVCTHWQRFCIQIAQSTQIC
jgi:hypothetical protein